MTEPEVRPYDFRRPATLVREHSRVLELAFDTFARQWGTQLTAKVRVLSQVTFEGVQMRGYDEYAAGLPTTTAMILCTLPESDLRAVLQFPLHAALCWINAMFGGTRSIPDEERVFTAIEYALVSRLVEDALEDLKYSLGPLLPGVLRVDGIQYHSQFAQAAPTTELMIVAQFTVRVGDTSAEATLAIPSRVILPQLGEVNPTVASDDAAQYLRSQLLHVPVDVSVRLVPGRVTPEQVLALRVGDVVPVPHPTHRPLDVAVDGHRVGLAAIGASGSRLAAVITDSEEGNA